MAKNDHAGHRAHLRQRFEKAGFKGFADHEIIELLLTLCIPRKDVKQQAKRLLKQFGNLKRILDADTDSLRAIEGIGSVTPIALKIIRHVATLYLEQDLHNDPLLNSSKKIEDFWRFRLGGERKEVFEVAYLDRAYKLLPNGIERLEEGTIDRAVVYPRKVVEAALKRSAAAIILVHNHPTGNTEPSENDKKVTFALDSACESLDIELVDHLIIADKETYSFRRNGFLS
ncbi:MAG: hypothetical protein A2Y14_03890 [Verrucomicrobia bacterium GWF2_51_19]|nr:MAG: hypothetical protein A2Y14_03890 [Verrucomicrobia bacterium GWF2_51_19]HCJ11699.1 hypothetical protein [Opitutae bacterium]